MRVEHRDLQWAVVACQHRSLRQAAAVLQIRQSTLSRSLRELEQMLGAALFERTNGGTRPTPEGQQFLIGARRILDDTQELVSRFKSRTRGECGELTIGVHASLSAGNLRATLIEYHRKFPNVTVNLVDGSSDQLASNLSDLAVDIAFLVDGTPHWNGASLPVWSERVVIALPDDHPLSTRQVVHWDELKGELILAPQRGPGPEFLRLMKEKLSHAESFEVQHHDVSLDRLLTLVGSGFGILLALEGATGGKYTGVNFREIHDHSGPTRLGLRACWDRTNTNSCLQTLLEVLRYRYPDLSVDAALE